MYVSIYLSLSIPSGIIVSVSMESLLGTPSIFSFYLLLIFPTLIMLFLIIHVLIYLFICSSVYFCSIITSFEFSFIGCYFFYLFFIHFFPSKFMSIHHFWLYSCWVFVFF